MPTWNEEHLAVVKQGEAAIREWRKENPEAKLELRGSNLVDVPLCGVRHYGAKSYLTGPNLSEADLRGADLRGAYLFGARFSRADLRGANLSQADLNRAYLADANLGEANLRGAILFAAILDRADLSGANLRRANLNGASLSGADLSNARCGSTIFSLVDFSSCIGLDTIQHAGPTSLDTHTLSACKLPTVFLQGCGVEQSLIEFLPSLVNSRNAISYFSVFISHSSLDKDFATRLHKDLQARGIRCWLDAHEILPGHDISEEIDRGIRLWDKVILCCSEGSLDQSWWVEDELDRAFAKEQEYGKGARCLIPLNLDGYLFEWKGKWAKRVRSRNAADFVGWRRKKNRYEEQLDRLVKALRADDEGRSKPPTQKLKKKATKKKATKKKR